MVKITKETLDKITNPIKISQGSCGESCFDVLCALNTRGISAQLLRLPNQGHTVVGLNDYIIDPAIGVNYGVGNGEKVFERKEHEKLMQEAASKEPFCWYMGKEVVYKELDWRLI